MKRTRNTKVAFFTLGLTGLCAALPFAMQASDLSFFNLFRNVNGSESTHYLEYTTLATSALTAEGNIVTFTYSGVTQEGDYLVFEQGGYLETSGFNALESLNFYIDQGRATVDYGFENTDSATLRSLFFDEFNGWQEEKTLALNTGLGGANYIRITNNVDPAIAALRIKNLRFNYACSGNSYVAPAMSATINGTQYDATKGADIDGVGHIGLRYNTQINRVVPTLDLAATVSSSLTVTTNENDFVVLRAPRGGSSLANLSVEGNTGDAMIDGYNHNQDFAVSFVDSNITSTARNLFVNTKVTMYNSDQTLTAFNIRDGKLSVNDNVTVDRYEKGVRLAHANIENSGLEQNENFTFTMSNVKLGLYVEDGYEANNAGIYLKGNTVISANGYEAVQARNVPVEVLTGTHTWDSTGNDTVKVAKLKVGVNDYEGFTAKLRIINKATNGVCIRIESGASLDNALVFERGLVSLESHADNKGDSRGIKMTNGYKEVIENGVCTSATVRIRSNAKLGFKDCARVLDFEPNIYSGEFNQSNFSSNKVKVCNCGDMAWYSVNKPAAENLGWEAYDALFNF